MTDAVKRQVVFSIGRVGVIQVDVACSGIGVVTVEHQAVGVVPHGRGRLRSQERHKRNDRILFHLARPFLVNDQFGRTDRDAVAPRFDCAVIGRVVRRRFADKQHFRQRGRDGQVGRWRGHLE